MKLGLPDTGSPLAAAAPPPVAATHLVSCSMPAAPAHHSPGFSIILPQFLGATLLPLTPGVFPDAGSVPFKLQRYNICGVTK